MAVLTSKILSDSSSCRLEAYYSKDQAPKIKSLALITQNDITEFALEKIWVNEQPASDLANFEFQILDKEDLETFKVLEDALFIFLKSLKTKLIKITYEKSGNNNIDETLELSISENLKVSGLRKILQRRFLLSDFRVHCNASHYELKEDESLKDYPAVALVFEENRIDVIEEMNKNGSSKEGLRKKAFVNFNDEIQLTIATTAPRWRTIVMGLNLEGECNNSRCEAYKQKVCIPLGMGDFYIAKECSKACCPEPLCSSPLFKMDSSGESKSSVHNCIFSGCLYSIEGINGKGELKKGIWKKVDPHVALSFEEASPEGPQGNIENWSFLKIMTKPVSNFCVYL